MSFFSRVISGIFRFAALTFACFIFLLPISNAQESHTASGPHIEVSLLNSKSALVIHKTIELGILFSPEQQWHTYWRKPGDSGEAPIITWQASQALT
jgi:DsbC/DsbD-like thiol-disulfide interchange protein